MSNWKIEQGPFVNNAMLEGKERAEIWFEGKVLMLLSKRDPVI
jgi:hypothetical protein